MVHGIIDIGSNTIRLNIYHVENKKLELLFSKKENAGLVQYVKKSLMSQEGIERLIKCLQHFQAVLDMIHVDRVSVFATASLRNIDNTQNVVDAIKDTCDISVDVLSGAQEGRLSFAGAMHGLQADDGIYVDTGGGSSEIILYDQKQIGFVTSLPIGSLNLYNKYVKNVFPTKQEVKAIQDRILKEIKGQEKKKNFFMQEHMAVAGGSMRAVRSLLLQLKKIDSNDYTLDADVVHDLVKEMLEDSSQSIHWILKCKPDRVHTLMPGLLIIDGLAQYVKAKTIQVSRFGVREGYLIEKVLKNANE